MPQCRRQITVPDTFRLILALSHGHSQTSPLQGSLVYILDDLSYKIY